MTADDTRPDPTWTIILPVKDTRVAKTRLSRLDQPLRATLALAFALDAAAAALACAAVQRVVVVTNDGVAATALHEVGADIVAKAPDTGLNADLAFAVAAVRRADPLAPVAALLADLPALRSDDLDNAFGAAARAGLDRWFVADAETDGTTMVAAGSGIAFLSAFGVHSRAAHLDLGLSPLESDLLARLRRDVDTEADLREATRLGVGEHTAMALDGLKNIFGPPEVA